VRGAEDDEDYALKLERDLDFMYETYKDRRDTRSKNRNGGSELIMGEEEEGQALLDQARKEEKAKLKAQKESRKRKREAGDSDTDDEDDMDRFNSDDDEESDTDDDDEQPDADGEESAAAFGRRAARDEDDSDAEEGENPLLRKLHREEAPSNSARMARWFQRGLLAEADLDGKADASMAEDDEDDADDEEERKEQPASRKAKGKAAQQPKSKRSLVTIGPADEDASSSEDEAPARRTQADDDMSDVDGEDGAAFFSNGKAVRTKSGLKPNSVLGMAGLSKSTAEIAADVMTDGPAAAASKKKGKKEAKKKPAAAPLVDEDGDAVDALKAAELKARAALKRTTKNYKAQEKERADVEKSKSDAFEEVPVSAEMEALEHAHFSSDDDAIAERMALGRHLLTKKSRDSLINDSYGRYSIDRAELSGLPEWFVRDEAQHHTPILPVSKAEVDTYKEQLRAINARPIRKIAEAKARKQVKTQKRWEKIKAQAEVIANSEGGQSGDKLRQIEKLFHQKSLKKEKKERVYVVTQKNGKTNMPKSSSGRKGKIVKVDQRQKKDKRGEKKAAQRQKKAKANKNKKQRKV